MSHELPPETSAPAEEPPPYSEIADGGNVSVDQGAGVHDIRRWDVQTNRPLSTTATGSSTSTQQSRPPAALPGDSSRPPPSAPHRPPPGPPPGHARPAMRPPPDEKQRPPPGRPPSGRPSHAAPSPKPSSSHLRPPPGRPSSINSSHSSHSSYSGSSSGNWQAPYSQNLPPQWPPTQANPHLRYPQGYFCKKCHNTGVKVKKGTTCKDCYERFGVRTDAQYLPPGAMPMFPVPPRVVMPGDPSIGGALCGRCRGAGVIHDLFIFQDTCPVCHGVGRVF